MSILAREHRGSQRDAKVYTYEDESEYSDENGKLNGQQLTVLKQKKAGHFSWTLSSLANFFQSVFLPQGYPDSVSSDYVEYQIYNSIQHFANSISGTLATQAVLKGFGVGNADATAAAATITWLFRDGTGHLGRIAFAYIQGTHLDADCKKWRLFADVINDFAIGADLLSPFVGKYFPLVQCISGFIKAIVGMAGGATRAAFTQHQARRNNLADVCAKDASQDTMVDLIGLIISLIVVPLVAGHTGITWTLYSFFTFVHIFCNVRAVKAVKIETFNMSRFIIFAEHFLNTEGEMLSVKEVNERENIWCFWISKVDVTRRGIPMGVSLEKHIKSTNDFEDLKSIYHDSNYILTFNAFKHPSVNVSLHENCTTNQQLEAAFQAIVIYYALVTLKTKDKRLRQIADSFKPCDKNSAFNDSINLELLKLTRQYTKDVFPTLLTRAEKAGFNLNYVLIPSGEWRSNWDCEDELNLGLPYITVCS